MLRRAGGVVLAMVGDVNGNPQKEHIMSPLNDAMIINGAVLIAVLEGDLGPHRKIGRLRILRPLVTVALVVPLFLDRPVTHGNGLLVELAGVAAGLLCGLVVVTLMRVYRSPKTGQPVSAAGAPRPFLAATTISRPPAASREPPRGGHSSPAGRARERARPAWCLRQSIRKSTQRIRLHTPDPGNRSAA